MLLLNLLHLASSVATEQQQRQPQQQQQQCPSVQQAPRISGSSWLGLVSVVTCALEPEWEVRWFVQGPSHL
jgi:hypothetical protein